MLRSLGKRKLVRDISANSFQTIATQVFTLLIFYVLSKYLPKEDFGEFNWSVALAFTLISAASLGLDLVYVKKVASGEDVVVVAGIHFFHCLAAGTMLSFGALLVYLLYPSFSASHPLFLLLFLNATVINMANSFRLCLQGLDSYRQIAIIAISANCLKFLLIVGLLLAGHFNVQLVIAVYLCISLFELALGYFLVSRQLRRPIRPLLRIFEYKYFILESLPQLGVMIFDSALSRMDIILLGLLSTAAFTAEYSFAYKVYELSKLPLLIIGPILLTRFSRLFSPGAEMTTQTRDRIRDFFTLQFFGTLIIPILLVAVWSPAVDFFTDNKYGAINEINYMVLAGCVPLVCLVNLYWTLGFVQNQMKAVLFITVFVAVLNVGLNLFLIPKWHSLGAAISFLASTVVHVTLYMIFTDQSRFRPDLWSCLVLVLCGVAGVIVGKLATDNHLICAALSITFYLLAAFLSRRVSIKKIEAFVNPK